MSGIRFGNFGTGKYNFGYIPDPPEPPSDSWFEEHCPKCKNNRLSATRADETLELGECLGLKMALKILDNIGKESEE